MAKKKRKSGDADKPPEEVPLKPSEGGATISPNMEGAGAAPPQLSPQEQFNQAVQRQMAEMGAAITLIASQVGELKQRPAAYPAGVNYDPYEVNPGPKRQASPGIPTLDPKALDKMLNLVGQWLKTREEPAEREPSEMEKWQTDFFKEYMRVQMDSLKVDLDIKKLERAGRKRALDSASDFY